MRLDQVSPHVDTGGQGLASFMVYLSSSSVAGGHTVFPYLDLVVSPRPGAALVWYGRDQAGRPDQRSTHLACPVIHGNKWAALKLIQQSGQWNRSAGNK